MTKLTDVIFRQPLLVIVAVFAVAKLLFLFRYHLPIWDEAVYLGMGKYVYSLGNAGLWEVLRPPGLSLLTGLGWRLGLPQLAFSEVVAVLFGVGNIVLCYFIAKRLFDRKVAILSAALLAAAPLFYLYSSYILTEVPSSFFILASVLAFISRRYSLSGSLAAVSMLFKFPNGLLLFAIAATVAYAVVRDSSHFRQQLLNLVKIASSFVIVTLPFLVFNYVFYRPFTSNPFDAVFRPYILGAWHQSNPSKAIEGQLYNYGFYVVQALKQHFVIAFIVVAAFIFWKKNWFNDQGKLLLGISLALYAAYFSYILNKDERFLILFLPALCIFSAAAFLEAFSYLRHLRLNAKSSVAARLLTVASVSLLLLSFGFALYNDFGFYGWRPSAEPAVASELYRSISNLGIKGPVLTSEPVFSAYNDNLFFPFYFTSFEGIPAELKPLNEWEQNKSFEAVIFSEQTLFCPETDVECQSARSNLYPYLKLSFREAFDGTFYDGTVSYSVFVNDSYRRT